MPRLDFQSCLPRAREAGAGILSRARLAWRWLAGVLKMHHFFPRAAKIQPKSARAQQLTPHRQHRQQLHLPHTQGHGVCGEQESLQTI